MPEQTGYAAWFRGRVVRPRCPEGRTPSQRDFAGEDAARLVSGEVVEEIGGLGVYLVYEASDGDVTERRVTCRKLVRRGTTIYLHAYCHEACAPRCFRVDRIIEMIGLSTGEVLDKEDQVEAFFRRFRMIEEMPTQMRAALTILVFLAACDHEVHPLEVEVLHDFIDHYIMRFGGGPGLQETARRMLGSLAPEYDDLERSIMSLMRRGEARAVLKFLEPWVDKVVAADGRMHDLEFEALIEMMHPDREELRKERLYPTWWPATTTK